MIEENELNNLNALIESLNPSQFKGLTTKVKSLYPDFFRKLKDMVSELSLKNVSEAIYLVTNNMERPPQCEGLSDKCTHKLTFKSITEGYVKYCKKCSSLSQDFIEKRKETNMDKYGKEFPNQNNEIKKKIIETKIENKTREKFHINEPLFNTLRYGILKKPPTGMNLSFKIGSK